MAEKSLEFGKRLERLLFEAKLNKKKLADSIGISPSAVGAYISEGRIPEAPILLKIARLLNISMEELLTGKSSIEIAPKKLIEDPELAEIVNILKMDDPEAKKHVLSILRSRISIKESIKGLLKVSELKTSSE